MEDTDDDICGAENRNGEPCQKRAGSGTDHLGEGRCRFHGGTTRDIKSGGPPEGNGNNERHGLRADRKKWFDRHRDDAEPLVRALVASYVDDAPFGWDATAKVDKLCEVAVDQVRLRESNKVLDEFLTEQVVGVGDDGEPIIELEEHPGHMPRDRIKRTNTRVLKELGILDDPDSQQAEATESLAELLAGGDE